MDAFGCWSFEYIVSFISKDGLILNYVWFPLCRHIFELVHDSDHEVLSSQICKLSVLTKHIYKHIYIHSKFAALHERETKSLLLLRKA